MRGQKRWIAFAALVTGAALLVLGCSGNSAPSTTDVYKAFLGGLSAQSSVQSQPSSNYTTASYGSGTFTGTATNPAGGTAVVSFTAPAPAPGVFPWTTSGTITFTNWLDLITGYTVNGTLTIVDTLSSATNSSLTLTGNLSLTGGTIDTLKFNVVLTSTGGVPTMSGTITANGYQFTVHPDGTIS
jgi:hypothetical protein